jgi:hypothetical protein
LRSFVFRKKATTTGPAGAGDDNVILNPRFEDGLNNWSGKGCKIELHKSMEDGKVFPQSGMFFASATNRTENWNGIEQDITGRVQRKVAYQVTAVVRIYVDNDTSAGVQITLWLQEPDFREQYISIAKLVSFTYSRRMTLHYFLYRYFYFSH